MLRKRSDHGLGAYLDPTDPRPRTEGPVDPEPNEGWMAAVWRRLIRRAEGRSEGKAPAWFQRPALIQFAASSPDRLAPYAARKAQRPYGDRLKPFNFMMAANVHAESIAPPLERHRCRIIAPFERDATRWRDAEWRDLYSGRRCRVATTGSGAPGIVVVESIGAMVDGYWRHEEWKSRDPGGGRGRPETSGLLPPARLCCLGPQDSRRPDECPFLDRWLLTGSAARPIMAGSSGV